MRGVQIGPFDAVGDPIFHADVSPGDLIAQLRGWRSVTFWNRPGAAVAPGLRS